MNESPPKNIDYVITSRQVIGNTFEVAPDATPGPIRFLRVPRNVAVPTPDLATKNARDLNDWVREVRTLADGDPNPHSISVAGDVLIFIHGYNNSLQLVMQRQRQLAADLGSKDWKGLVVSFDWPSGDQTLAYWEDRSVAAATALRLVSKGITLLAKNQNDGCATNVHLLAHSTGAYVVMEAFAQAEKDGALYKSAWRVSQVAFISADVASASLSIADDWSAPLFKRLVRLTNYSNGWDAVLAASNAKRLGVEPRAGRVGLPDNARPKAVNVDCTNYFAGLRPAQNAFASQELTFSHSWQFGDPLFALDLAMTLEGAADRNVIPTRAIANGKLSLVEGSRPASMAAWNLKPPASLRPLDG
ncbi:MAG: alpha/beta hydrolase [Pseudolabrys sp.]